MSQQPQWSPPPQRPTGWGGPGYGAPPPRPMGVTLAAVYLLVMGILLAPVGGCVAAFGTGVQTLEGAAGSGTFFGGGLALFGVAVLVGAIIGVVAGAGALSGSGWARWLGVLASIMMVFVFALLAYLFFNSQDGQRLGILSLIELVLYGLSAFAFLSAGRYFAARR